MALEEHWQGPLDQCPEYLNLPIRGHDPTFTGKMELQGLNPCCQRHLQVHKLPMQLLTSKQFTAIPMHHLLTRTCSMVYSRLSLTTLRLRVTPHFSHSCTEGPLDTGGTNNLGPCGLLDRGAAARAQVCMGKDAGEKDTGQQDTAATMMSWVTLVRCLVHRGTG